MYSWLKKNIGEVFYILPYLGIVKNPIQLIISLIFFNYLLITSSNDIDIDQFFKDLNYFNITNDLNLDVIYLVISLLVTFLTMSLITFFKPFAEIYLIYYLKISYYFLINLVSLSTVYIVLRVYGYSRFYLLLYLFVSTLFLTFSEKLRK